MLGRWLAPRKSQRRQIEWVQMDASNQALYHRTWIHQNRQNIHFSGASPC